MSLSFCAIYCTLSTASDGAENAIDHAVASFLVFWDIEKAELRKKLRLGYINLIVGDADAIERSQLVLPDRSTVGK